MTPPAPTGGTSAGWPGSRTGKRSTRSRTAGSRPKSLRPWSRFPLVWFRKSQVRHPPLPLAVLDANARRANSAKPKYYGPRIKIIELNVVRHARDHSSSFYPSQKVQGHILSGSLPASDNPELCKLCAPPVKYYLGAIWPRLPSPWFLDQLPSPTG